LLILYTHAEGHRAQTVYPAPDKLALQLRLVKMASGQSVFQFDKQRYKAARIS
jgi:hypothetical protein